MIKDAVKWIGAFALAYVLVNIMLIPYYHYTPGIPLSVNATKEIYYPNSAFLTTGEGYSSGRFDKNGYLNPPGSADRNDYVLVMGSSHTMGKEVPEGFSFCGLLSEQYGIPVYNMGMDGHLYTDIIAGFSAALEQFPDSGAVVIETGLTEFDIEDLKESLKQREYDPARTGTGIVNSSGTLSRIKSAVQTWLPYRILLKQKLNALKAKNDEPDTGTEAEYREAVDATMRLMRDRYDKKIVIVYHPAIMVDENGRAYAAVDNENTKRSFADACSRNDIVFYDMSDVFIKEYEENNRLPHGFMNTSMGTGHLNMTGHKLIAGKLAEILEQ